MMEGVCVGTSVHNYVLYVELMMCGCVVRCLEVDEVYVMAYNGLGVSSFK